VKTVTCRDLIASAIVYRLMRALSVHCVQLFCCCEAEALLIDIAAARLRFVSKLEINVIITMSVNIL
jgi:hypothetical protein